MGKPAPEPPAASENGDMQRDAALCLDFYRALLTGRQAEILDYYYNEDYSLSEIADCLKISRQAAHDSLRGGAHALAEFEAKLGLAAAHRRELARARKMGEALADLERALAEIREAAAREEDRALAARIDGLSEIARRIKDCDADGGVGGGLGRE